jgi:hypothetical protein
MAEPIDVFSDGVQIFIGAYGCAIHFSLSTEEGHKTTPADQTLPGARVATIRVTPEFAKGLAFFLRERILMYEAEHGAIVVPPKLLERLASGDQAKWEQLWRYTK